MPICLPPPQRASVLLLRGQRLRSFSSASRQRHPWWVREPCDGESGPGEGAVQGRHVDVQRIRQEQIHVRHTDWISVTNMQIQIVNCNPAQKTFVCSFRTEQHVFLPLCFNYPPSFCYARSTLSIMKNEQPVFGLNFADLFLLLLLIFLFVCFNSFICCPVISGFFFY